DLLPWMEAGRVDIQVVFQVNQGACHRTPDWNPFIGNDYIAKIQNLYPGRVLGLATINPWLQPPKAYTHPLERRGQTFDRFTRNLAIEECGRAIGELGLHGVKMHPKEHGYPVNHAAVPHSHRARAGAETGEAPSLHRHPCRRRLDVQHL